ncbi:MAG: hypothetical protein E7559_05455 [Ruminococcaceae bacterium]|nr:hypothetical protein [Oscillospiraceae bacterium]
MSTRFWYSNECIDPNDDDAFLQEELDNIVDLLRESSFLGDESGLSIEERMTEVFRGELPQWIAFQTPDAVCYVNCFGVLRDGNREIPIELQFEIAEDMESFIFSGLLIDDVPQPEEIVIDFESQFSTE